MSGTGPRRNPANTLLEQRKLRISDRSDYPPLASYFPAQECANHVPHPGRSNYLLGRESNNQLRPLALAGNDGERPLQRIDSLPDSSQPDAAFAPVSQNRT